ncbi:uncharacterized protein SPPG_03108 [Spizellomyces punctatus DAOM BR117]|uniref:BZIP domain-containing protein n=1 Tax=Spizellomyces punctatus (strain DAOM BR117) TaxID=645134 RepID=A0A0L0HJT4_SPIPD|nr:uncharacterized protein SPPG_03108 [Spizellomyces punctatus DAOM BR117]KND01298.1 hypothetical protein SPPG_03108 [Spizellomyces punctatus DAOM BR117]|eukprot:XP_016609337.1 hypothetical protein SPPG_03108 [Spizellomyces punctatus DAOM BR117]
MSSAMVFMSDTLPTPTLLMQQPEISLMDDPAIATPTRFLQECSEFKFTPGIITRYCSGDFNPFENSFKEKMEASGVLGDATTESIPSSTMPPSSWQALASSTPLTIQKRTSVQPLHIPTPMDTTIGSGSPVDIHATTIPPVVAPAALGVDPHVHMYVSMEPMSIPMSAPASAYPMHVHPQELQQMPHMPQLDTMPTIVDPQALKVHREEPVAPNHKLQRDNRRDSAISTTTSESDEPRKSSPPRNGKRKGGPPTEEEQDEKRKRFLERNRLAASKCRMKKKQWLQDLENRSTDASAKNRQLQMIVTQLKEEVMMLKNQLLLHRNCSCNVIQQYISTSSQFTAHLHNPGQHMDPAHLNATPLPPSHHPPVGMSPMPPVGVAPMVPVAQSY